MWLAATSLMACEADDEEVRYNDVGDLLRVDVGEGFDTAPRSTELHSGVGRAEIGVATVDPGAGPVGTVHRFVVEVYDSYEGDVSRVSLALNAGERGVTELDLDHDLADIGLWALEVETLGAKGEARQDVARIRVWTPAKPDAAAEGGTVETAEP
jgi:hypothetical protein